ncbi:hypothetical protein LCGC14_0998820 [marine sediment metagenome]|uniref:Uncharacterized protein n=1 Tax=marine sediment metagenome TaxID=412755 RepID=A0A0F9R9U1_9ZZZZ
MELKDREIRGVGRQQPWRRVVVGLLVLAWVFLVGRGLWILFPRCGD